ncbi:Hypothetical protein BRZCDTV_204 [Brazilian cedratvirus IHUMI]|uniref:Uncharacterized protein n=1 Tax=Brazilian cedratvirus IHUMI TaxID=2126980 RepID=A0A2R8FEC2_9VIRU|nr:Hypothetical protein BRZCDTV_204 [Brazilian cedratvirus IHUMI]
MFALPSLGKNVTDVSPSLSIEAVIDVQVVPSHKKTFTLSSYKPGWEERPRVEIPLVAPPPLARNVPATEVIVTTKRGRGRSSSPRMKRIGREAYTAALKSLPPLPEVQTESQGLSLTLPQIPQTSVMLPNVTSAFIDIPQEEEEYEEEEEITEPGEFNWGSEPEDEEEY